MKQQLQPIDACRLDLFTSEEELREKYDMRIVARILRVREEYNWFLSNPDSKDRQFVETAMARHGINKTQAYSDLAIVKALLPQLSQASRDFHRYRYNEMILETFQMAKKRKDTKTMEKAASSYAKFNRVDLEDEQMSKLCRMTLSWCSPSRQRMTHRCSESNRCQDFRSAFSNSFINTALRTWTSRI